MGKRERQINCAFRDSGRLLQTLYHLALAPLFGGRMLLLYGVPVSQPVRSVMWALYLKQQPFELKFTLPRSTKEGGARHPEFLKVNPFGTIPALVDDGFALYEASAILCYLADKYQWVDLYPRDVQGRARVHQYLSWHHLNTRQLSPQLVAPILMNTQVDEQRYEVPSMSFLRPLCRPITTFLFAPRHEHYTNIGPMPRVSALYPGAYASGYIVDIRGIWPNSYIRGIRARAYPQISEAYDPGSLRATLPSPLMLNTSSRTNPRHIFSHGVSSKLSINMEYRHISMVYWEPIMSVTQDSHAQEPNFGGNLSLAQDIWYTTWQMSHVTGCSS